MTDINTLLHEWVTSLRARAEAQSAFDSSTIDRQSLDAAWDAHAAVQRRLIARIENPDLACSFCGKTQREVKKLIAGPIVFICDECIRMSADILEDNTDELPRESPRFAKLRTGLTLHLYRLRAARRGRRHENGPPRWLP